MDRGLNWARLSLINLLLGLFFHLRGVIIDHSLAIVTMESSVAGKQRWKVARNLVQTSTFCCFSKLKSWWTNNMDGRTDVPRVARA
jgi:hypothetical protein